MPKYRPKKYWLLIIVIVSLIFLHAVKILSPVESFASRRLRPVLAVIYLTGAKLRTTYNQQTDKRDLAVKLIELEKETSELIAENAKLKVLEEENKILRQQLNFLSKYKYHSILANIVSRGESTDSSKNNLVIIIDKGSKDGILPGLAVVAPLADDSAGNQGVIIGKVMSVKDYLSEVYLATNQNCKLGVLLDGQNKTNGIARGELGLTIRMEFIPQTIAITDGQIVMTSGLEPNIPRGLAVGKVSEIVRENNELWQSAVVEPLINYDDLTVVSIILP